MILSENLFQSVVSEFELVESFDPSIPSWLIRALESSKIKNKLLANSYDLEHLKFVRIPESEVPTNGFHPLLKDPNKQLVYLLRDRSNNHVYLPGINDDVVDLHIDEDDYTKTTNVKYISKKNLLNYVIMMGYIDREAPETYKKDLTKSRRDARIGGIQRGLGQYPNQYKVYDKDADGNTDWDKYHYETEWNMTRGQDKSGYKLDPEKYKRMLDQADLSTYSRQFDRYAKKLELVRQEIMSLLMQIEMKNYSGRWGASLQSIMSKFEDALQ